MNNLPIFDFFFFVLCCIVGFWINKKLRPSRATHWLNKEVYFLGLSVFIGLMVAFGIWFIEHKTNINEASTTHSLLIGFLGLSIIEVVDFVMRRNNR